MDTKGGCLLTYTQEKGHKTPITEIVRLQISTKEEGFCPCLLVTFWGRRRLQTVIFFGKKSYFWRRKKSLGVGGGRDVMTLPQKLVCALVDSGWTWPIKVYLVPPCQSWSWPTVAGQLVGFTVQVVPASSPEAVVPLNTSWTDYVHRHHRPRSRHASPNMLSLPSLNANLLVYDKYAVCKFEKKRALWTNWRYLWTRLFIFLTCFFSSSLDERRLF